MQNHGYKVEPHRHTRTVNGPITWISNGRGVRAWLPQLVLDPGYVYEIRENMTMATPMGETVRCCRWCALDRWERFGGHAHLRYLEQRPAATDRCPVCGMPYAEEA